MATVKNASSSGYYLGETVEFYGSIEGTTMKTRSVARVVSVEGSMVTVMSPHTGAVKLARRKTDGLYVAARTTGKPSMPDYIRHIAARKAVISK